MIDANEQVVLLDSWNRHCGTADKLQAHRFGLRHLAFSIFIMDDGDRILLQRRALSKYHSAGLWANTCCGHPRPGEPMEVAASRRLHEEMGIACDLAPAGEFLYRASVGSGLVEHEYDHVFVGRFDDRPAPAPDEVMAWRRLTPGALRLEMAKNPDEFAVWLGPALDTWQSRGSPLP